MTYHRSGRPTQNTPGLDKREHGEANARIVFGPSDITRPHDHLHFLQIRELHLVTEQRVDLGPILFVPGSRIRSLNFNMGERMRI